MTFYVIDLEEGDNQKNRQHKYISATLGDRWIKLYNLITDWLAIYRDKLAVFISG